MARCFEGRAIEPCQLSPETGAGEFDPDIFSSRSSSFCTNSKVVVGFQRNNWTYTFNYTCSLKNKGCCVFFFLFSLCFSLVTTDHSNKRQSLTLHIISVPTTTRKLWVSWTERQAQDLLEFSVGRLGIQGWESRRRKLEIGYAGPQSFRITTSIHLLEVLFKLY